MKPGHCPNPGGNPNCTGKAGGKGLCMSCAMCAAWERRRDGAAGPMSAKEVREAARKAGLIDPGGGDGRGDGLDGLVSRIEAEVRGLVADCAEVVELVQAESERMRRRNLGLLKFACQNRRKIAALKERLREARARAAAAQLAEETDQDDKDDEDEESGQDAHDAPAGVS